MAGEGAAWTGAAGSAVLGRVTAVEVVYAVLVSLQFAVVLVEVATWAVFSEVLLTSAVTSPTGATWTVTHSSRCISPCLPDQLFAPLNYLRYFCVALFSSHQRRRFQATSVRRRSDWNSGRPTVFDGI